jgi:hypothetical protein
MIGLGRLENRRWFDYGPKILWHDMKSLADRLKCYFKNVRAFERVHPTIQPPRHALFFYASDGPLHLMRNGRMELELSRD